MIYFSTGIENVEWAKAQARLAESLGMRVGSTWHEEEVGYKPDMRTIAKRDLMELDQCSVLITNGQSKSGGAHSELGYAIAKGIRCILVGERVSLLHWLCEQTEVWECLDL